MEQNSNDGHDQRRSIRLFDLLAVVAVIGVIVVGGLVLLRGGSAKPATADQRGQSKDMTKFNTDLAKYMTKVAVKEGGEVMKLVTVTATCTPVADDKANCDVVIRGPKGNEEKATAENVRREGDKFVWDRES